MNQAQLKKKVAEAAIDFINDEKIIGIGTGSTVDHFIEVLARKKHQIEACVASSKHTEKKLRSHQIPVINLNYVDELPIYIDSADACNPIKELVKGGGGALTREKILAYAAKKFICIVDNSKTLHHLGHFPVPIEVLSIARSTIARAIVQLGGKPVWRQDFITDNGNQILDIYGWIITHPIVLEEKLNQIPGIICNGVFAIRGADLLLIGNDNEITVFN